MSPLVSPTEAGAALSKHLTATFWERAFAGRTATGPDYSTRPPTPSHPGGHHRYAAPPTPSSHACGASSHVCTAETEYVRLSLGSRPAQVLPGPPPGASRKRGVSPRKGAPGRDSWHTPSLCLPTCPPSPCKHLQSTDYALALLGTGDSWSASPSPGKARPGVPGACRMLSLLPRQRAELSFKATLGSKSK